MNNEKTNIYIGIALIISFLLIFFAVSSRNDSKSNTRDVNEKKEISENVLLEEELQTVTITSRAGGYTPKITYAKSSVHTILEMNSVNSYGCERAFRIPSLNISKELPNNGTTTFDLGTPEESITGTCSMGMYVFTIKFI